MNKESDVSQFLTNEKIKKPYENSFMLVNHCIEKARASLALGQGSEAINQNVVADVLSEVISESEGGCVLSEKDQEVAAPRLVEPSDVIAEEVLAKAGYTQNS